MGTLGHPLGSFGARQVPKYNTGIKIAAKPSQNGASQSPKWTKIVQIRASGSPNWCPKGKGVAPPRGHPLHFGPPSPKTGFGHNLQHMAPFGATTSGFCMVFQPATLIFSTLDPIFGAPGPGLGPRRPGPPFGAKNGGLKNMILWRVWSPTRFDRIFQEGNGFHGTQEPFGCTNFPPNPPRERFYRDFAQTRKSQGPPWPSMVPA